MGSVLMNAVRGAVAGAVATWLMDLVTTGMLQGQAEDTTERERAARPNGKGTVPNLVDRIEAMTGSTMDDEARAAAAQAIHFGLGVGPGALYGAMRGRLPLIGSARGVLYGVVLWALNDEYLNIRLGLAAPFRAYPMQTHWRGLVGHAVLGAATDTVIDILGGTRRRSR